ncbi:MAG TPA: phosphotransferase [Marmoricola sp.]|nr:phosphotransferase [Marmoricola sp.]
MWQPEPGWTALRPGGGASTVGLWRTELRDRPVVVKRLRRPSGDDPDVLGDPAHAGYWRREAEVALEPGVVDGPGVGAPAYLRVDEDDEGVTLWSEELVELPPPALRVARALGVFGAASYVDVPWAARHTLTDRLVMAEARGGWPTLARTQMADVADQLWQRRRSWLDEYAAGPAGRLHGDAVPANFPASRADLVVAVDWQGFGIGPLGTDLGYYALSAREDFEVLLDAFLDGARSQVGDVDEDRVRLAATVMCVYSAISRAEWALARVASGEGALHGKFRHPSVAPYLRALQRQLPQVEALLV